MKRKFRPVSIASRIWIAAEAAYPPFAIQIVIEGNGKIDRRLWEDAIKIASEANKGSRLVLRGHLWRARWEDSGKTPGFTEVDGGGWNARSSEGADFIFKPFDLKTGPLADVVVVHGEPIRIFFRAHHSIMDGRGIIVWVEDIFRVLRGEQPLGSDHLMIEDDLLNVTDEKAYQPIAHRYIPPTGRAEGHEPGFIWRRVTVTGKYPQLLAQIMFLTAKAARLHEEGAVRFGVPVDLRSRMPRLRSTSNLTNAIFIEVPPDATVDRIAGEISQRVANKHDGQVTWEDKLIPYIPLKILTSILRKEEQRNCRTNQFRFSGLISNIGKLSLEPYSGGGFEATGYWCVPVYMGSVPLTVTVTGYNDKVDMVFIMRKVFASNGRLEEIIEYISKELVPAT